MENNPEVKLPELRRATDQVVNEKDCKFLRTEVIRHKGCKRVYLVRQTPATCLHNNVPCYMLEQVGDGGEKIHPFYRNQTDVESMWEKYPTHADTLIDPNLNLFQANDLLRCLETNESVVVIGTPTHYRLGDTLEPAYIYQGKDGFRVALCQSTMESGQFEKVN